MLSTLYFEATSWAGYAEHNVSVLYSSHSIEREPDLLDRVLMPYCRLQLMSLFRTYDVTWPDQTQQNLSWADVLNVGLSVSAPGCWIPHYNFYVFYLIQMAMPVSDYYPKMINLIFSICLSVLKQNRASLCMHK